MDRGAKTALRFVGRGTHQQQFAFDLLQSSLAMPLINLLRSCQAFGHWKFCGEFGYTPLSIEEKIP